MVDQNMTGEVFYPSSDTVKNARVRDWEAISAQAEINLEGFWAKEASELHWFEPWSKVLDDSKKPFYQWFVGGKTNIAYPPQ
jgi:acetyl-CoA synthetase